MKTKGDVLEFLELLMTVPGESERRGTRIMSRGDVAEILRFTGATKTESQNLSKRRKG